MKAKKIFTGVLASALFLSSSLAVFAASDIEFKNPGRDMRTSYSKTTENGVGYMYYHVGSKKWGDDVFAYSETKIASGMEGYASVTLVSDDNRRTTQYSDTIVDNSYIRTPNAGVSGRDIANKVNFIGARKDGNQDYVGFNYTIHKD